jgi:predicted ATPase
MIKSIILENFFSFGQPKTIVLNPRVNVLVGINGSGKTNFLNAIRLLMEGVGGGGFEKVFLTDWGGFPSVANFSGKQSESIRLTYEFDKNALNDFSNRKGFRFSENPIYTITIHQAGTTGYYLEELLCTQCSNKTKQPFIYLQIKNGKGIISTREQDQIGIQRYPRDGDEFAFKEQELVLRQISDPDRFYPIYTLRMAIESMAVYDYFDTTPRSVIRQPGTFGTNSRLLPNGENLVQILLGMKNNHSLEYEEIEILLKSINPTFKDIGFQVLGAKILLVLREKNLAKTVGVDHVSDGTIRFLLLLAIFINPQRGSLICIDEPETGLHPDMINTIADCIKKASLKCQVFIATHSPLLLNSFEPSDLLIFEKDINNSTLVMRKSEEEIVSWNDDSLLGQLWLNGNLGGKRW